MARLPVFAVVCLVSCLWTRAGVTEPVFAQPNLTTGNASAIIDRQIALPIPKPPPPDETQVTRPETSFFKIASGNIAGSYFATGEKLAEIISHPPGSERCSGTLRCGPSGMFAVAHNSDGAVVNIRAVASGSLDSGLAPADLLLDAYEGKGLFAKDGPLTTMRLIANLYPESLHLVVSKSANITQVQDLKGLRVSLGPAGSGTQTYAQQIIERSGLANSITSDMLDLYEAADQLLSGELDAFFYLGGVPAPLIQDILTTEQIKLIPITGVPVATIYETQPYTEPIVLSGDVYPNTPQTETIASTAIWFVNANISEERVYRITAALWHENNQAFLTDGRSPMTNANKEAAINDLPLPLHPGAERYYQEAAFFQTAPDSTLATGNVPPETSSQDADTDMQSAP